MMFDSAEKKLNALEFRISELEVKLNLLTKKDDEDYNLKVLKAGLLSLAVLGLGFLWVMIYKS